MNGRVGVSLLALLLAACARPAAPVAETPVLPAAATIRAEQAAVANEPLPEAVEAASAAVSEPLAAAVEVAAAILPEAPTPPPVEPLVAAPAVELIVRWEVTSPARYKKALAWPIYPGGASGITWGIGYDGGHQRESVIADDWKAHGNVAQLVTTAGITGSRAKAIVPQYRSIYTDYDYARQIFGDKSLIEYERRTQRAFGDGYLTLRPLARGALVSLVYNRGASMTGDSRREMKAIRDECVPAQDYACIARQIRSMNRLWRGTSIQNGMFARREAEAILVETVN